MARYLGNYWERTQLIVCKKRPAADDRMGEQPTLLGLLSHAVIGVRMVEVALEQLTDFPEELSLRMRHLEGLYA